MSNREDIESERLIYTCNCGWIDTGHMDDDSTREFVGPKNLWKQIREGDSAPEAQTYRLCPSPAFLPNPVVPLYLPPPRVVHRIARFPDGMPGFKVTYRQDMSKWGVRVGVNRSYLVRYGLSWEEQRRVALAIFMGVSKLFEGLQGSFPWKVATDSGFSQEDLVSNLLGFYIAIGDYSRDQVLSLCEPVSKQTAFNIWDREGPVGENKNRTFQPDFAEQTGYDDPVRKVCIDECAGSKRAFPEQFRKLRPALKGRLFIDFPRLDAAACYSQA